MYKIEKQRGIMCEKDILDKVNNTSISSNKENYYGTGDAADKFVEILQKKQN